MHSSNTFIYKNVNVMCIRLATLRPADCHLHSTALTHPCRKSNSLHAQGSSGIANVKLGTHPLSSSASRLPKRGASTVTITAW